MGDDRAIISFYQKKSIICYSLLKKLTAILFLALMIFNLAGYRLLFYFAQQQSDKHLRLSLDRESYNEEDLITIKVNLLLPYPPATTSFERVDGEINIRGKIYKYVKRKVQDGGLVLVCLPDKNKIRLENARDDYFKQTSGFTKGTNQGRSGKSRSDLSKNMSTEYVSPAVNDHFAPVKINNLFRSDLRGQGPATLPHRVPEKPPQVLS
jgi:hypothetical protein